MKKGQTTLRYFRSPGTVFPGNGLAMTGVILCLGCSLLNACLVAPAAIVTSALVTSAGIVNELEKAGQKSDDQHTVTVKADTEVYEGPGEEYSLIATLCEGDEIKVLQEEDDWIQCCADRFERGWIRQSGIPNREP